MSFDASQLQTYPDFSPVAVFDPAEDFGTDFTSESAGSPQSPLSPALSASSFGFPTTDAWTSWGVAELQPESDDLFGCQTFSSCPPPDSSLSLAINPVDLAAAPLSSSSSLFDLSQLMLASMPAQWQQQQQQQQEPTRTAQLPTPCPTTDAALKRYPSRGLKCKSTSWPPSNGVEDEPAPKPTSAVLPKKTAAATAPRRPSNPKSKDSRIALAPKKAAHNMIEKRYRTNLNGKITQLRDAVPSLRMLAQQQQQPPQPFTHTSSSTGTGNGEFEDAGGEEDGLGTGLGQGAGSRAGGHAAKLNKSTILTKATEYILQLERKNQGLEAENNALRGRMEGLEFLLMGAAAAGAPGRGGGSKAVGGWD